MTHSLAHIIKQKCLDAGFVKAGIAKAEPLSRESVYLKEWIEKKFYADMTWMNASFEKRINPELVMKDCLSVISLAYVYDTPVPHSEDKSIPKISRYAWGQKDYHKVIKKKLKTLCAEIETLDNNIKTKFYVDDGPVMDKAWAVRAGVGWMGKNTNVINPEIGSFFFLATILINVELEYDTEIEDYCKSCNLCVNSCPTGALYEEYKLDANLCISYHTIENRNEIPDDLNLNGWIFGCDICQDVCPFNGKKIFTSDLSFYPRNEVISKTVSDHLKMNEQEFNKIFEGTPIMRTKYEGFQRNLKKLKREFTNN